MKLYFVRELGQLVQRPGTAQTMDRMTAKLRDIIPFTVAFIKPNGQPDPIGPGDSLVMKFGVKKLLADTEFVSLAQTFTPVADSPGVYAAELDLNTTEILEAIGSNASLSAVAELTYSLNGGTKWQSSANVAVTVNTDVITGDEGMPNPANSIPATMAAVVQANAISYTADQTTVSRVQRRQARRNAGVSRLGHIMRDFGGLVAAFDKFKALGNPTPGSTYVGFVTPYDSMGVLAEGLLDELGAQYGIGGLAAPGFGRTWNNNAGNYAWTFAGGASQPFTDFTYFPGAQEIIIPAGGSAVIKVPDQYYMDALTSGYMADAGVARSRGHRPLPKGIWKVQVSYTKVTGAGSLNVTLAQPGYTNITSGATATAGALGVGHIELTPANRFGEITLTLAATLNPVRVCMVFAYSESGVIHWNNSKGSTNMSQQLPGVLAGNNWNAAYAQLFAKMNTALVAQCQRVDGNPTYAADYPKFWDAWGKLGCSQLVMAEPNDGDIPGAVTPIYPVDINDWLERACEQRGLPFIDLYSMVEQGVLLGLGWTDGDVTHLDPPFRTFLAKRIAEECRYFEPGLSGLNDHVITQRGLAAERFGYFPYADIQESVLIGFQGNSLTTPTNYVSNAGSWTAATVNNEDGWLLPSGTTIGRNTARIGALGAGAALDTNLCDWAVSGIGYRNMDIKANVRGFVLFGGSNTTTIQTLTGLNQRCFGLEWALGSDVGSPNGITAIVVRLFTCDGTTTTFTPWIEARQSIYEESVATAGQSFVIQWDRERAMLTAFVAESTVKTYGVRSTPRFNLSAPHLAANACAGNYVHMGVYATVAPTATGKISFRRFHARWGDMGGQYSNRPQFQKETP